MDRVIQVDMDPEDTPTCPLCDQPIIFADWEIATAGYGYFLAHAGCVIIEEHVDEEED